jgi:hypothetical protein
MKNYEKYEDELKEYKGRNFCKDFVKPNILKSDSCDGLACGACYMLQTIWLLEDYEEPKTDWSKVEVDTPVLVRDGENNEWQRSYFAKYEDGFVYTWIAGATSWTAVGYEKGGNVYRWNYAKLAESEETK